MSEILDRARGSVNAVLVGGASGVKVHDDDLDALSRGVLRALVDPPDALLKLAVNARSIYADPKLVFRDQWNAVLAELLK